MLATDAKARAGHVVGPTDKVVLRQVGAIASAIVPARCIVENHAASFLQKAVGVNQPGAGNAGLRILLKGVEQGVQPALGYGGVVVEKNDDFTGRRFGAAVAGGDEPGVFLVGHDANA